VINLSETLHKLTGTKRQGQEVGAVKLQDGTVVELDKEIALSEDQLKELRDHGFLVRKVAEVDEGSEAGKEGSEVGKKPESSPSRKPGSGT
jgi:hypothetical protein